MAGRKRAKKATLAPDRLHFLQTYRELQPRGGKLADACRSCGITIKVYERWRRNDLFKANMDALKKELAAGEAAAEHAEQRASAAVTPVETVEGGMTAQQILYIDTWRETQDRKGAWEHVGLTWEMVKRFRAENLAFAAACAEVEEEMDVQAEDAQRRRAIENGDTAAINSLRKAGAAQASAAQVNAASRKERQAKLRQEMGRPN